MVLRLNRSLQEAGWERTVFDYYYACWLLWSDDRKTLEAFWQLGRSSVLEVLSMMISSTVVSECA